MIANIVSTNIFLTENFLLKLNLIIILLYLLSGVSYETGMKKIYAVKSDGELISGMEVFRQIYKVIFIY